MTAVTARLAIDAIAAGGDGVARHEGRVVFVPRTAPGDVVDVKLTAKPSDRFARGLLRGVVSPSPMRITPPCPHYDGDRCGGCQLQHVEYGAQLDAKATMIADAFDRIAKRPIARPEVRRAAREWRYRSKLTMAIRFRDGRWFIGMHPYDAPAAIFAVSDCLITDERVVAAWRDIAAATAHLPRALQLRGAVRQLADGVSFTLEGASQWPTHQRFLAAVPVVRQLWWIPQGAARRLLADRQSSATAGASFVQINADVAAEMHAHVIGATMAHAPRHAVDAYAGAGDTAVALAGHGLQVTAIEVDADAARQCANRLPAGSRCVTARVEDALDRTLPTDVVILNPPRAGVEARVTHMLDAEAGRVRAIVYVSCNPATLARDVARLPQWRVVGVTAFDMFPQTAHVETVCELEPVAA